MKNTKNAIPAVKRNISKRKNSLWIQSGKEIQNELPVYYREFTLEKLAGSEFILLNEDLEMAKTTDVALKNVQQIIKALNAYTSVFIAMLTIAGTDEHVKDYEKLIQERENEFIGKITLRARTELEKFLLIWLSQSKSRIVENSELLNLILNEFQDLELIPDDCLALIRALMDKGLAVVNSDITYDVLNAFDVQEIQKQKSENALSMYGNDKVAVFSDWSLGKVEPDNVILIPNPLLLTLYYILKDKQFIDGRTDDAGIYEDEQGILPDFEVDLRDKKYIILRTAEAEIKIERSRANTVSKILKKRWLD